MARWRLTRQSYGAAEFIFSEGDEITIGRAANNTITLSSLVISRQHCVLKVYRDKITIKDLRSSNGTYIGSTKIPQNTDVPVTDSQCIGIGWMDGASLSKINDNEKFVFKVVRDSIQNSIRDKIVFHTDNYFEDSEEKHVDEVLNSSPRLGLKRKFDCTIKSNDIKQENDKVSEPTEPSPEIINLLSDSESEECEIPGNDEDVKTVTKKPKLDVTVKEEPQGPNIKLEMKSENEDYDLCDVKQELLGYDDEPINLDSDSDSESEMRWYIRLSQSSPGKPLKGRKKKKVDVIEPTESSYSQIIECDDDLDAVLDDAIDDAVNEDGHYDEEFMDDLIRIPENPETEQDQAIDQLDGFHNEGISSDYFVQQLEKESVKQVQVQAEQTSEPVVASKSAQIIEPLAQTSGRKSRLTDSTKKEVRNLKTCAPSSSSKHSKKSSRSKKNSHFKRHMSDSQREERKKRLKEIATKEKEAKDKLDANSNSNTVQTVSAKVSNTSRGAFLTETTATVKPTKRKEQTQTTQKSDNSHHNKSDTKSQPSKSSTNSEIRKELKSLQHDIENTIEDVDKSHSSKNKTSRISDKKDKDSSPIENNKMHSRCGNSTHNTRLPEIKTDSRLPLKTLKPLTHTDEKYPGKPISKVEPLPVGKPKKTVRFSEAPPQIRVFEIEDGHQMKKTSLVKTTLLDVPQKPCFSLEKITLMRILRWNPHWLKEQINNNEPPPILGSKTPPIALLHYFQSHTQYVDVVGDLLLMEIWESVTQTFMKSRLPELEMRIESMPPVPSPERSIFDMFNISVNVSLPKSELKTMPRMGELMHVTFGPEDARNKRFFYVHNVRTLPSPPNNVRSFFSISLHSVYTDSMRTLRPGELILGRSMSYIKNVLQLFEAMEHLARSPLCEAILRPSPRHFVTSDGAPHIKSPWTSTLNENQLRAVSTSVCAALGDRPSVQMIQGPPGTGKSSVICSIVMTYFYDLAGKRMQNRGKVLICATSNAAVDELVIRLLKIRQTLPKSERFRMVRVGRPEAMHPRARDLSSQHLAQRDVQLRCHHEAMQPGITEEIARQEARLNMWRSQSQEAKDPARAAFCQTKIEQIRVRIAQLKGNSTGEVTPQQLAESELRIIENADIIVSTLASVANAKMRGLKRRIALCIVDEAGQAIEPDTLIPLTLDVTRLTLIGDPQQLPGFIKSQRARKHGLGDSLFSRLSATMEDWNTTSPVVLLNVQYRMHPAIADYPNKAFYDGKIINAARLRNDHPLLPYTVVYISSGDKGQGASGANEMEAWGVARLVIALNNLARKLKMDLAVITPYEAQREAIRNNLRLLEEPTAPPVEVNTVDSFQGQERDVVVVSLARSRGVGFLSDAGRMNVMLTRARHALFICLNPNAMLKNQQWRTLIDDAHRRKLYTCLPNSVCRPTTSRDNSNSEDILKHITYQSSDR